MDLHRIAACCAAATLGVAVPVALAGPAAAGGGCPAAMEDGPTEAAGDTVALAGNCMGPTILHADAGTTVTFVNEDTWAHNVRGLDWGTDALAPDAVFAHTFDEAGTYPYTCTLHPGMVGAVEVGGGSAAVAAPATQPVSSSPDGSDGMALGGVAAVAAVAFGAGAGAMAVRRRRVRAATMGT